MVLPIIGGAALLGFITFGEEFLGKKTFKKILTILILLGIGIVGYIIYKMYKTWEKAKETAEDTVEDIKDVMEGGWEWVFKGGAKEETERILTSDPRWEDEPEIKQDIIWSGEMITQLFGGSAYTAGQETAQKTYDSFEKRYGIDVAKQYEELPGTSRGLISFGDYITGSKATDLGYKTGKLINKYKFW